MNLLGVLTIYCDINLCFYSGIFNFKNGKETKNFPKKIKISTIESKVLCEYFFYYECPWHFEYYAGVDNVNIWKSIYRKCEYT